MYLKYMLGFIKYIDVIANKYFWAKPSLGEINAALSYER